MFIKTSVGSACKVNHTIHEGGLSSSLSQSTHESKY